MRAHNTRNKVLAHVGASKPPKQKTLPEFKYGHPCLSLVDFIQVLPGKFNTKTFALA